MCTLIIRYSLTEYGANVWLGANRDEQLARASVGPKLDKIGDTAVFAPRDGLAGGTWIGINEYGVVAAITNRFGLEKQPTHRSRGWVVLDALEENSAVDAADRIWATRAKAHNGFHLVVADRKDVFLVWNDGESLHRERLQPGIHVLTERSLGAGYSGRPAWLAGEIGSLQDGGTLSESDLIGLLQYQNDDDPLEGTCIRVPGWVYGTRSSTIIELEGNEVRFLHAEGAPCVTPYLDFSADARRMMKERQG